MAKSKPIGVRFDLDLLSALSEDKIAETPQKVLNFLTEFYRENKQKTNFKEVFGNSKLFNKKEVNIEPQNPLVDKSNFTVIPPCPVKEPGEDSFDFAARKNAWKIKYNQ